MTVGDSGTAAWFRHSFVSYSLSRGAELTTFVRMPQHIREVALRRAATGQRKNHPWRVPADTLGEAMKGRRLPVALLFTAWAALAVCGESYVLRYQRQPGERGHSSDHWPSRLQLGKELTLVMFLHPHCPCSKASITQLEKVMKAGHGTITAWVVLTKPNGAEPGWEQSELVKSAESIPDASVYVDDDAVETRLFGPVTSGHVLVYDPAGRLVFSGGLTPGRGEAGASA